MVENDNKIREDVAVLKEQVSEIKDNHLVHIQENIQKLFGKMDKFTGLIITTLITVIIGLVMIFFK